MTALSPAWRISADAIVLLHGNHSISSTDLQPHSNAQKNASVFGQKPVKYRCKLSCAVLKVKGRAASVCVLKSLKIVFVLHLWINIPIVSSSPTSCYFYLTERGIEFVHCRQQCLSHEQKVEESLIHVNTTTRPWLVYTTQYERFVTRVSTYLEIAVCN